MCILNGGALNNITEIVSYSSIIVALSEALCYEWTCGPLDQLSGGPQEGEQEEDCILKNCGIWPIDIGPVE